MAGTLNVALVGNPNVGKTTLFNSLTGLSQHVGNYPGVTVSKFSGPLTLPYGERVELTDLPGIYSLAAASLDERVVIDVLTGTMEGTAKPDAVVCVLDANNLPRNLFLATQVAELGLPMALAVNQIDLAEKDGLEIDADLLRRRLGVPVIKISARKNEGIDALKLAVADILKDGTKMKSVVWNSATQKALKTLRENLDSEILKNVSDVELQRVIFDVASPIANRLKNHDIERVGSALKQARACIRAVGDNPHSTEAVQRYAFIKDVLEGVVCRTKNRTTFTSLMDKVFLNRVAGPIIFLAIMYGVFYSIYTLASFPMDWIESVFGSLKETLSGVFEGTPVLQSLIVDGIVAGVGGVLVFLPQILILFFFLGLLESTGYMSRAAFLMDKLFSWCGLNGKSFVPMLSGFACGIPGIMGARTIEDPKARLATIVALPFMSCSARMPVYVLMCAILERLLSKSEVYAAGSAGICAGVFVGMYLVGIVFSVPVAWFYTHVVLKSTAAPFVLEMPRYQFPRFRDVFLRVWQSGTDYVSRAGTVIFAMSVLIWALSYFPHSDEVADNARERFLTERSEALELPREALEARLETDEAFAGTLDNAVAAAWMEDSFLGKIGKTVQPVFAPCGFDWRITVGLLGSFPARELIVSTLGITYSLGSEAGEEDVGLFDKMLESTHEDGRPVFTIPVVIALMVFFALCMQCLAEVVVFARETSWKWAAVSWTQMTVIAWLAAALVCQIGSLF